MSNSTLTKSSGDESTPNSNSDSLSPPKSDNSSPPSEKEKSSSSSEDGKSSPPSDKDKSSSPSEDDKPSPPSEKDKSSSPSEDDKSSPPPEDDKSSSPPPPPSDDSESQPPPSPPISENYPTPLFSPPPPPAESDESTSPPSPSLSSSSPPSPSNEASPPPPSSSGTSISPPSPSELSPPPTDASSSKLVPLPPVSFIPPFPPSSQSNVVIPLSPGSKWPSLSDSKDFLSSHNKDPGSIQVPPIPNTNTEVTPVKSSPSSNSESTTSPSGETDSSSSRSSSMGSSKAPSHSSTGPIVSVTFAAALLVLVAVLFVVVKRKRRVQALEYRAPPGGSARSDGYYRKHAKVMANTSHSSSYYASQQMPSNSSGIMSDSNGGYGYYPGTQNSNALKPCFSYEEMAEVTNDFSQENLIGQGGFGCVYKGILPDGRQVAVKELKAGSGQGEREFRAEVDIISIVHHRHLVSLVGYCIAEYHRLLVYEFVPNDTLEHHLHDKGVHVMEWSKRVKVAIGAARGLAYLHEDCHPRIIHRDIKSANILLDNTFEAKVADFGLAKLSNDTHTHISTRVMGTFGYMAPEYASTGKLTDRSDVYSFGVVLLELITGRKPVDSTQPLGDESLVEWARPLLIDALESGNCEELVDPRLENNFHKAEMFAMIDAAAACVRHSAPKRPPMVKVARALDSGGEISDLTNGVKYGQSQAFNSDQYSVDIQKFRGMVFTSESSVHAPDSREYEKTPNSREHLLQWPVDQSSHESETCAIYNKEGDGGGTRIPSL